MIKLHQCINDTEEHKEVIRIAVQQDYDKFELFDWNLKGIIGIRTSDKFQHRHIMQHSPQIYGPVKSILNKSWEFAKSGVVIWCSQALFYGGLVTATISVWLGPKSPLIASAETAVATLTSRPRLYDYIGFAKRNLNTVSMLFRIECVMICIFLAWGRSSVAGRTWWKPKGSFCRVIGCY